MLAFIYRHRASLASADQIVRLVGYGRERVGAALQSLVTSGLILRSRNSRGFRLYRFADAIPDEGRRVALELLIKLSADRSQRLILLAYFQQTGAGKRQRARDGLHLA